MSMLFRNDKGEKKEGVPAGGLRVPLLPLRDIIVFPHMVVPLFVGRQKSIKALEEAMNKQKFILLAAQKDAKTNDPGEEDIYRVGTLKISGNRLWLRDKKGYRYFYCHLSDFAAAAYNGADVHAGEVIGFVGNTGDAEPTPPHLHFEVHMPDGTVTDPYPYLQKWDQSGVTSASWLRRYGKDPGVRPGALVVVKDFLAEG